MDSDKKINGIGQLIFKLENKVNHNLIKKMRNVKLKERKIKIETYKFDEMRLDITKDWTKQLLIKWDLFPHLSTSSAKKKE